MHGFINLITNCFNIICHLPAHLIEPIGFLPEFAKDAMIDSLNILPFLFIVFVIIEVIEQYFTKKRHLFVFFMKKVGPIFGSLLASIPQCGFSVMATNLYVTRLITLGTLISIYLSTSDEMLPILISEKAEFSLIIKILLIKLFIGMLVGFIIDKIISIFRGH